MNIIWWQRERERVAYLLLGNINRAHNVPESSTVRWWRWQRLHNKLRGHELEATHFMLQKKNQNKFIRFCLSILEFKWQKWNRCVILLSDVQSAKIEKLVKKKNYKSIGKNTRKYTWEQNCRILREFHEWLLTLNAKRIIELRLTIVTSLTLTE